MLDWRLLRVKTIEYFKNSYFRTQTTDFSIIYPSISSSHILNKCFLKGYELSNKQMIDFINATKSKYLLIDQNLGENISEEEGCCWSQNTSSELAYISDSILTCRFNGFTYANNGSGNEYYFSIKISTGKQITIDDILKSNSIDTVLTILRNKYKSILQQKEPDPNLPPDGNDAPFSWDYSKNSNVFLTKTGLYFRERAYKLGRYYDLFLSYKEINDYLSASFKTTINCP
jgi:hypothetical protein